MELPIINHKDYFAKIGDDHKFPIKKFEELANYLKKKKDNRKFSYTLCLFRGNIKKSSF